MAGRAAAVGDRHVPAQGYARGEAACAVVGVAYKHQFSVLRWAFVFLPLFHSH